MSASTDQTKLTYHQFYKVNNKLKQIKLPSGLQNLRILLTDLSIKDFLLPKDKTKKIYIYYRSTIDIQEEEL